MGKILSYAILVCGVSLMVGWYRAETDLHDASSQADNWDALYDQVPLKFNANTLAQNLKTFSLFPDSFEEEQAKLVGGAGPVKIEDGGVPEFPLIVSVAYRDNRPLVILRNADKDLQSATSGDILENGWQIKSINLKRVVALFEGDEHVFSVVQYDLLPKSKKSENSEQE